MSVIYSIAVALDVTVQQFKESPGFYYDHIGEAKLYNTEWKFVTYTDLELADGNFETEIMRSCLQNFVKGMSTYFGLITQDVRIAYDRLIGKLRR